MDIPILLNAQRDHAISRCLVQPQTKLNLPFLCLQRFFPGGSTPPDPPNFSAFGDTGFVSSSPRHQKKKNPFGICFFWLRNFFRSPVRLARTIYRIAEGGKMGGSGEAKPPPAFMGVSKTRQILGHVLRPTEYGLVLSRSGAPAVKQLRTSNTACDNFVNVIFVH